jgi:hypothetical protein
MAYAKAWCAVSRWRFSTFLLSGSIVLNKMEPSHRIVVAGQRDLSVELIQAHYSFRLIFAAFGEVTL